MNETRRITKDTHSCSVLKLFETGINSETHCKYLRVP